MTVIAVRKYHDRIEMAADGLITIGNLIEKDNAGKINRISDHTILGASGASDIVKLFHMRIARSDFQKLDYDEFLEIFLKDEGISVKDDDSYMDTLYASNIKGPVIYKSNGFHVCEIKEFTAIGAGSPVAIGALEYGASPLQAVAIACKITLGCGGLLYQDILRFNNEEEKT